MKHSLTQGNVVRFESSPSCRSEWKSFFFFSLFEKQEKKKEKMMPFIGLSLCFTPLSFDDAWLRRRLLLSFLFFLLSFFSLLLLSFLKGHGRATRAPPSGAGGRASEAPRGKERKSSAAFGIANRRRKFASNKSHSNFLFSKARHALNALALAPFRSQRRERDALYSWARRNDANSKQNSAGTERHFGSPNSSPLVFFSPFCSAHFSSLAAPSPSLSLSLKHNREPPGLRPGEARAVRRGVRGQGLSAARGRRRPGRGRGGDCPPASAAARGREGRRGRLGRRRRPEGAAAGLPARLPVSWIEGRGGGGGRERKRKEEKKERDHSKKRTKRQRARKKRRPSLDTLPPLPLTTTTTAPSAASTRTAPSASTTPAAAAPSTSPRNIW